MTDMIYEELDGTIYEVIDDMNCDMMVVHQYYE